MTASLKNKRVQTGGLEMKSQSIKIVAFLTALLMTVNSHAFDVGGLVSDGEGGYADVGFGGIQGSGDLGLSDADLGGGFGVSSGDTGSSSSSGSDAFGGGEADGGVSGGSGSSGVIGQSGSDTLGIHNNGLAQEISEKAWGHAAMIAPNRSIALDAHAKAMAAHQIDIDTLNSVERTVANQEETSKELDRVQNEVNNTISEMVDVLSQFSGALISGTIDLTNYPIFENSYNLSRHMYISLKKAKMLDPITRLGMKGVSIHVLEGLPSSLYAKELDAIFLSREEVKKYGAIVLYHELMHAGLEKAVKSGAISQQRYEELSNLNLTAFGHLDGYVGNGRGYYEVGGYGYQEAVVIGWSFQRLQSYYKDLPVGMHSKSEQYMSDVLNNKALIWFQGGTALRMISSTTTSQNDVKDEFLTRFQSGKDWVRTLVLDTQAKVRNQLPNLCAPGQMKVTDKQYCGSTYVNPYRYNYQICGTNYRFGAVTHVDCGQTVSPR